MRVIEMEVRPGHTGEYGGRYYGAGCRETMSVAEAAARAADWREAPAPAAPPSAAPPPAGDLAAAIAALDPAEAGQWTTDGRPQVAALAAAAGRSVTAQERDEAWASYQARHATQAGAAGAPA